MSLAWRLHALVLGWHLWGWLLSGLASVGVGFDWDDDQTALNVHQLTFKVFQHPCSIGQNLQSVTRRRRVPAPAWMRLAALPFKQNYGGGSRTHVFIADV
ncbi:hypothetical protein AAMO2058_001125400 [Amorphochlora amoebiformis]|uniref:Secreted protein n=1 Tax=Amorphochlora amoebiformis TaxID=1561963 RepID=A0A7S0H8P8_9EUKA